MNEQTNKMKTSLLELLIAVTVTVMLLKWNKIIQENQRKIGRLEWIKGINPREGSQLPQNTSREEGTYIFVSEHTPLREFRSVQTTGNIVHS